MNIARACEVDETVEDFTKWLSSKSHWLLLIDNADDPDIDISEFVPPGIGGSIIITTRNPDFQKYATVWSSKVGEMISTDAALLLCKVVATDVVSDDATKSAARVVAALDYLALAIVQAGAIIRQGICSLDGFCDLYARHKKKLLESSCTNERKDYPYSVFTTWNISIQQIERMADVYSKLALDLLRIFSFMHFSEIQESIFERACQNKNNPNYRIEG